MAVVPALVPLIKLMNGASVNRVPLCSTWAGQDWVDVINRFERMEMFLAPFGVRVNTRASMRSNTGDGVTPYPVTSSMSSNRN